jgi:flagellar FliJ protein
MNFQYRFATILQLRRRQRDEAGAALGQAHEAIRRVDAQVQTIQRERMMSRQNAHQQRLGAVSVDSLLVQGRYDLQLQTRLQSLGKTRGELDQELQRRQHALIVAEAEVKRFEKLEEKERNAFHIAMLRRQQAESDDATSSRYIIERQR